MQAASKKKETSTLRWRMVLVHCRRPLPLLSHPWNGVTSIRRTHGSRYRRRKTQRTTPHNAPVSTEHRALPAPVLAPAVSRDRGITGTLRFPLRAVRPQDNHVPRTINYIATQTNTRCISYAPFTNFVLAQQVPGGGGRRCSVQVNMEGDVVVEKSHLKRQGPV